MDDHISRIQLPCRFCSRRLVFMIGIIASLIIVFQTFTLPYRSVVSPLLYLNKEDILSGEVTIEKLGMSSSLSDTKKYIYSKELQKELESAEVNHVKLKTAVDFRDRQLGLVSKKDVDLENVTELIEEDMDFSRKISLGLEESEKLNNLGEQITWVIPHENVIDQKDVNSTMVANKAGIEFAFGSQSTLFHEEVVTPLKASFSSINGSVKEILTTNPGNHVSISSVLAVSSLGEHKISFNSTEYQMTELRLTNKTLFPVASASFPTSDFKLPNVHLRIKKSGRKPISVPEMRQVLLTYQSSNHQKRSSVRDRQLLAAKQLLQKAPTLKSDAKLYEPAFLNISKFKKSYELMERMLKIYIYKEGNKPVFHQPLLRGIYASEGWFMKLLQTDKHFVVRDHRKAHLFYIPFSSRLLQLSLYVQSSHSHRNLAQYLKNYVYLIAAKYPFWNRTGGADHFVVACHDWAPHITAQAMGSTIRALCNADLRRGFQLGKDVSLPEIYVRSAQNPLRDLGGNSAENRSTLAFYAGNLHGRLRPILLRYWENKDPDMKILGPMLPGVESKMIYIQHMKNSKYCICPRGYEVNSPRVVESIYYECVPVIISDNYVPPFIEVLNWEAFSVIIPEENIPRLKDVLVSISEERYKLLQLGVRKVQQHFLWHSKPVKYDLFHMILHSIWYNRLHQ